MNITLELSNFLHFSRWIAAFLVVISHLRSLVFTDYELIANKNIFIRLFYFLTGFGHEAVIIFFVMSGFLIGGSIFSQIKADKFSLVQYIVDRFSRIYIVFPLSLILGLLLDWIGYTYFNASGLYTNQINIATIGFNISERLGIDVFVSNIFMLQTITSPPLGSNGPLWSLANEWWYYFYFPLIILTFTYKKTYQKVLCILAIAGLSVVMYNSKQYGNMLIYFSVWITGSALWLIKTKRQLNFYFASTVMILYLVLIRIKAISFLNPFQQDFLLGIFFGLMIKSLHISNTWIMSMNMQKINKIMASFSYSLYLIHMPIAIFMIAVLSHFGIIYVKTQPIFLSFLNFFLILIIVYTLAFYFAILTERKTFHFKNLLWNIFFNAKAKIQ